MLIQTISRVVAFASILIALLAWHYRLSALIFLPACFISVAAVAAVVDGFLKRYPKRRRDLIKLAIVAVFLLALGLAAIPFHRKQGFNYEDRWGCAVMFFLIVTSIIHHVVTEWLKRKVEEDGWREMVKSDNFSMVLRNPEFYRLEFMEWLKETHPRALLQLEKQFNFQPPENSAN
jgi:hypothetical protein